MAMAEVDTFHLKVIFQRFLRSFLQKAETHLTEGSLRSLRRGLYMEGVIFGILRYLL